MMIRGLYFMLGLALGVGCGGNEDAAAKPHTTVVKTLTPREAVAELKLQMENFRPYYYCEQTYPQKCDDLPTAYVLPREGSEPYRVVFSNNQDRDSTWVVFDYVTVDAETKEIVVAGQFQWFSALGPLETKGKALWGVPQ